MTLLGLLVNTIGIVILTVTIVHRTSPHQAPTDFEADTVITVMQ